MKIAEAMMLASIAPAMGMAVLFTTSKGETLAMPDTATITAVIGETLLAMLEANCIGSSMATGGIAILAATTCAKAAKAKKTLRVGLRYLRLAILLHERLILIKHGTKT